jgi:hypothetical protein
MTRDSTRRFRAHVRGLAAALTLAGLGSLATPAAPARADVTVYRIDIGLPNTVAIVIRGRFTGNEILRFKAAVADVEAGKRIVAVLDSPGGIVAQGDALGRFFHDAKIPTMVLAGTTCASACTHAFLGGRDPVTGNPLRILVSGAKLGFHNFRLGEVTKKSFTKAEIENAARAAQQMVYRNLEHLLYVKAPLEVLRLNTGTRTEDLNYITEGDALDYGIAVLDLQTGHLVLPEKLEQRTRKDRS